MDETETELRLKKNRAILDWLMYIEPTVKKEYSAFIRNKIWNTNSLAYKLFFTPSGVVKTPSRGGTYKRKALLLVHPDKCKEEDAGELVCLVSKLTEQDLREILESDQPLHKLRTYKKGDGVSVEDEIQKLENTMWYTWHTQPALFKDAFLSERDLVRLKEEHELLLRENAELQEQIKTLRGTL